MAIKPFELRREFPSFEPYLAETEDVDFTHPAIGVLADALQSEADETAYIRAAFEYVRDRVAHAWDIQSPQVTRAASEVLEAKAGICYAKSNLLCALLRRASIPTGFCYQRLTLGDTPDTGYVIHALNAVYIRHLDRWIRLDARGNKPGVDAQFSMDVERLAFPIRAHYEEIDYPMIHAHPHPATMAALRQATNTLDMYLHGLPSTLE